MSSHLPESMAVRARAFDAWAWEYDRFRPSYPQALFDHIAARLSLPADAQVADLGAGTGKAARQMARRGWHVTAVEPGEGMLDVMGARAGQEGLSIDVRLAGAEDTDLPSESVDLVTAAQAFHWFDKPRAVHEMARIVRPTGGVAVFWNARADERSEFLTEYTELMTHYLDDEHIDRRHAPHESTTPGDLTNGGWFTVEERVEIPHEVAMGADDFIGLVFTASQVQIFVDDEAKQSLRRDLQRLMETHFGGRQVRVAYDVEVYVAHRTAVEL